MSGIEAVAVLGVRLGARVAWRLATQRADVHTAILWDPIIDGRAYVAELIESQRDVDRRSLAPRARQAATSGEVHVNGFPLTVAMRRDIEALQLPEFATETRAAVTLFFSEEASGGALLSDTLRSAGTSVQVEVMPGQTPWGDEVAIGSSSVPIRVVTRLVETLG
jgi:pimeloyl-ACP methyl ester carboxylesterase